MPRQGYRFIGLIERPVFDVVADAPPLPRSPWRLAGLAVIGLVVAAAISFVLTRPTGGAVDPDPRARPTIDRLAVLPFENLSPDPANAFFADGMHEEVLSALGSRARKLEVISRTTMLTYRGKPTDVPGLARDLGATHVLEGSVRREASTVRVTLQLVDAIADRQIWSQSYQATLVDAMTLQEQLARAVAEQLAIQLPTARTGQLPPPRNPDAYDQWLKGTLAWQDVGGGGATVSEIDRVEAMFTRALELDDTYGAAYADSSPGPRRPVRQPRRWPGGEPRRRPRRHRAGAEVRRRDAVCARPRRRRRLPRRLLSAPRARPHRSGRAGRTARCRSAADQGQLPDVRRAVGGVAGRAGAGRPPRPGQRRHLSGTGCRTSPRRGVLARCCGC